MSFAAVVAGLEGAAVQARYTAFFRETYQTLTAALKEGKDAGKTSPALEEHVGKATVQQSFDRTYATPVTSDVWAPPPGDPAVVT